MHRVQRLISQFDTVPKRKRETISIENTSAKWTFTDKNQDFVRLTVENKHGDSSVVDISVYGAHVTRWEDNQSKADYLFLSKKAILDGSKPIRGGIPVCWPVFGGSPFGSHGFARRTKWKFCPELSNVGEKYASVTFSLTPSAYTKKIGWDVNFRCEYTVKLVGCAPSVLDCSLKVINPKSSPGELSFTGGFHTYYRISSLANVTVDGLDGAIHHDRMKNTIARNKKASLKITEATDSFYRDTADCLTMTDSGYERKLVIQKSGFPDAVVWNPHISLSPNFKDLASTEYDELLCVEAVIKDSPVRLQPGESFSGRILQYWEQ